MADLTLSAAFPLNASDDSRLFFALDTDQVQSRALDDVPTNFISMVDLNWAVEYAQSGRVDDTLSLGIRIVNGATILAAADSGGTFATVNSNVTNTTEITTGPTAFAYVNTGASAATWNGASVELEQTIVAQMMTDGCRIFVDFVEFTGSFAGSETVTHTTDLRVGLFVAHTTDLNVSEFTRPTATNSGLSSANAHKMGIDANGTVWMVGTATGSTPQTIRLWEGGASGPGFWQLHEFNHGSGRIRDVGLAIIDDAVHIIYINHVGSSITQYHIEWPIGGNSFTNNGSFGTGESHSDETVSINAELDVVATADDELVVMSKLTNYVNFGGSTAFRYRTRLYKSSGESFSGISALLYKEWYGPNIFDRPSTPDPVLTALGNDAVIETSNAVFSAGTVGDYHPAIADGHSMPVAPIGEVSSSSGSYALRPILHNGVWYTGHVSVNAATVGYIAATAEENPRYDRGAVIGEVDTSGAWQLFIDHRGFLGGWWYDNSPNAAAVFVSNGLGDWFPYEYTPETGGNTFPWYFQTERTVERSFSAWARTTSGDWVWLGVTIPTWYIAHTTDVVIAAGDAQVYHTTDLLVVSGRWGITNHGTIHNPRLNTFEYNSNFYYVMGTNGFDSNTRNWGTIEVFESPTIQNRGDRITLWDTKDISGANGLEFLEAWDMVHDGSGTIHFIWLVWDNSRFEAHHSEYDIDLDTWTHNGAFYTGPTMEQDSLGSAFIAQRADGDLIAFFLNRSPGDGWHYAINSGAGFGAATSMGRNSGFSAGGMAIDGNDTHMMVYEGSNMYHWHLSSTDVLGSIQGPNSSFPGTIETFPSSKPLVHNNIMYVPGLTGSGQDVVVYHAATGADAPTWTATTVTTKDIDRICALVTGVGGVPTLFYVEKSTWTVWKATLEGGSWTETSTSQTFPVEAGDLSSGELKGQTSIFAYPSVDSNGHAYMWWRRVYEAAGEPSEERWYPYRVNLNRIVSHTTDLITVEGSKVVNHTTDLIIKLVVARTHTTDVVLSEQVEAAVSHSTDVRKVDRTGIVHTTDVYVVEVLTHTTDLVIAVAAHDLSATIILLFDLDVILEAGDTAPATGLGIPRRGKQGPHIYNPRHRVVKKR